MKSNLPTKCNKDSYELDLTWGELAEQRAINEAKNNPRKAKIKKYV
jgi:hypothetical protein